MKDAEAKIQRVSKKFSGNVLDQQYHNEKTARLSSQALRDREAGGAAYV